MKIVKTDDKWFAALGLRRITETFESREQVENHLDDLNYKVLLNIIGCMIDDVKEFKEFTNKGGNK